MVTIRYGPPEPSLPFEHTIHVRVTQPQRDAIEKMATEYQVPASALVRHFVMQAIDQLTNECTEDGQE